MKCEGGCEGGKLASGLCTRCPAAQPVDGWADASPLIKVQATKIIGTRVTVYTAWEPNDGHSTITYLEDGKCYGRVGTGRLPEALDKLKPYSDERYNAVKAWFADQYRRAYKLICDVYPEAAQGRPEMGEIEVVS